jgi:hypothetical protein
MKQGVRLLLKPKSFFNQLQWSSNHWAILLLFLVLATIETQVGRTHVLYNTLALYLNQRAGINYNLALWMILAAKLALFLAGAFLLTTVIYLVGSLVGSANSHRVLSRRLAIVFTVLLSGFTVQHLVPSYPELYYVSMGLYGWGLMLGFIAIKEQFHLGYFSAAIIAAFAFLMVTTSWNYSNQVFEASVKTKLQELARQNAPRVQGTRHRINF